MLGIPREVAEHHLLGKPDAKLVKQRLWRFDEDRWKAIGEDIAKLQAAGFIKEVYYPNWVANPMLI